jgi:hypothetical protein
VPTNSRRIGVLMDAEPGTPEGDELDVLTDLVVHHEEKSLYTTRRESESLGNPPSAVVGGTGANAGADLDTILIDCARNRPAPPQPAGR